ncbi:glycoside hydrolase [Ascodesmis nigricans]|uniref:Glycoside hydrolase n=1 Tax=Ascodesmis nigricans TaxID=341454 RepID=A0A4S2MUF8_9PEZI|nr:glycoside hydrolase [Ascodesmis nigricans]
MFTRSFSTLAIALLAASQLAVARPARHAKRNEVVVEEVVTVWVDQYGQSVDPNNLPACVTPPPAAIISTPPPAPTEAPKEEVKLPVPEDDETIGTPTEGKEPGKQEPVSTPQPSPSPPPQEEDKEEEKEEETPIVETPPKTPSNGRSIVYSPYHAREDGKGRRCKSEAEIKTDIETLSAFDLLRLYSTDCKQVSRALQFGTHKLFIGLENTNNPENEYNDLLNAVKENGGSWDRIDTVSLGNEVTNFGKFNGDNQAYAAAINAMRERLRSDGFQGSVVGADTFIAIMSDPTGAVCKASDYIAANAHPFFDGGYAASEAGNFLRDMARAMTEKLTAAGCTGKEIRFAETGWPKKGDANGRAEPSLENQAVAVKSILEAYPNTILFTAFDDKWKEDTPETKGTEQHWGIAGVESL